jgi:hypothetical protein
MADKIPIGYDWIDGQTLRPNGVSRELFLKLSTPESPFAGEFFPIGTHFPDYEIEYAESAENLAKIKQKFIYVIQTGGYPDDWLINTSHPALPNVFHHVSELVKEENRQGRCVIAINCEWEGFDPIATAFFKKVHELIKKYKLRGDLICYLTSNFLVEKVYDEWCSQNNVHDKIKVFSVNFFAKMMFEEMRMHSNNFVQPEDLAKKTIKDKYFLSLNRRPHHHRWLLVANLLHYNLLGTSLTSFGANGNKDNPPGALNGYLPFFPEIETDIKKLKEISPIILDVEDLEFNHVATHNKTLYLRTFFSVVPETLFDTGFPGGSLFFSEKIYKAIANCHPFVLVGQPNSLRQLKELGFETFEPFIDEKYDQIESAFLRMRMVIDEINRLCLIPFNEWQDWFDNVAYHKVIHNRKRLEVSNRLGYQKYHAFCREFCSQG